MYPMENSVAGDTDFESADMQDTIGGRISRAREAIGLSSTQLARRIGVRTQTLRLWETDRSEPRSNRLAMLAAFLNVSPTWLLMGRGEAPVELTILNEAETLKAEIIAIKADLDLLGGRLSEALQRLDGLAVLARTTDDFDQA